MLPRSQRLSAGQLQEVMKKGRVTHSPLFLIRVYKTPGPLRIAAVVPKKVAKTAVERNRVRRLMYRALQKIVPTLSHEAHLAFFAKQGACTASVDEIAADMSGFFKKI